MAARKNEQESAFPGKSDPEYWEGLTKREYFAAKALQGYIACGACNPNNGHAIMPEDVAKLSVEMADHLIKQLNEKQS